MSVQFTKGTLSVTKNGQTQEIHMLEGGGGSTDSHPLGKVVVFGDSLSSGYNSLVKWTDYLTNADEVRNYAIAGSTFGSGYAIDTSVRNQSCEDMITNHSSDILWADTIILSYGGNDSNACANENTSYSNAYNKAISCFDTIQSMNPNARLIYVYPDTSFGSIDVIGTSEYYKNEAFVLGLFSAIYNRNYEVYSMTGGSRLISSDVQSDHKHPTDAGIEKIGKALNSVLANRVGFVPRRNIRLYLGAITSTSAYNPHKYKYDFIHRLLVEGCTLEGCVMVSNVTMAIGVCSYDNVEGWASFLIQISASGTKAQRAKLDIKVDTNGSFTMLDTV